MAAIPLGPNVADATSNAYLNLVAVDPGPLPYGDPVPVEFIASKGRGQMLSNSLKTQQSQK